MLKTIGLILIVCAIIPATITADEPRLSRFEYSQIEMAVPIRVVLYAADKATADRAGEAVFARFRELCEVMSDYDPTSELRQLCDTAGQEKAVAVSDDLWRVLVHADQLAKRTDGAFDVTVGPVVRLWRRARRTHRMPPATRLAADRKLVGHHLMRLDPKQETVTLLKEGMRLDLGGIAKGFAIDEALTVLREMGISRALVDAGGDIGLSDPPPGTDGWRIAIAKLKPDEPPSKIVSLARASIATSGDAWQFVVIGGRRYSHLVDPKTGLGLTDHSSVTIVAPNAMAADGLASAVSILGPKKGIALIEKTPKTAAFIVRAPNGKVETYESVGWKQLPISTPLPPGE